MYLHAHLPRGTPRYVELVLPGMRLVNSVCDSSRLPFSKLCRFVQLFQVKTKMLET
jgi:hypothetical protein